MIYTITVDYESSTFEVEAKDVADAIRKTRKKVLSGEVYTDNWWIGVMEDDKGRDVEFNGVIKTWEEN